MARGFVSRSKKTKLFFVALFSLLILGPVISVVKDRVLAQNTQVRVNVCYPPAPPSIITPTDGQVVSVSSVQVEGTAQPNVTVYIERNGTQIGFVTSAGDGTFSFSANLVIGANALQANEQNLCGDREDSNVVNVTRNAPPVPPDPDPDPNPSEPGDGGTSTPGGGTTPPAEPVEPVIPTINQPVTGSTTDNPNIIISGRSTPNTLTSVYLNGVKIAEVLSDDRGRFSVSAHLKKGVNFIYVSTGAGSNLLKSEIISVAYEPFTFAFVIAGIEIPDAFTFSLSLGVVIILIALIWLIPKLVLTLIHWVARRRTSDGY